MKTPKILQILSDIISQKGGKAIIVGGSVRDHFLGIKAKDFDIEVFGLSTLSELEEILKEWGRVELVGKSFGVLKFIYKDEVYDFAFPRVEKKVSQGHRGFEVEVDPKMEYKEAARRRDFTINSMGYDIKGGEFLDPFGGISDLEDKILRSVDSRSFVEDPLRVYRGVQFCARFDLIMANQTKELCKEMVARGDLEELAKERVFEEFKKLLLRAQKPSIGFELMRELGILRYFPELNALIGVEQDPIWHPEGDVWTHTMMVIDEMAKLRSGDDRLDLILMFGALCHDFGKATTTEFKDGRLRSHNHEKEGVEPTKSFLQRLTNKNSLIDEVTPLVANHLAPFTLHKDNSSPKAIRRLSTRVNINNLILVAKADFLGRGTIEAKEGNFEAGEWLKKRAKELEVEDSAPKPLLQGRDLIDLGLKPSKRFKEILDHSYEMQLDGKISTKQQAIKEIKDYLA